jgi:copper(I)-binding protein
MNNSTLKQTPFFALVLALLVAVAMVVTNLIGMATASAADYKTGMITVMDPWARGTPRSAGAFMTIHNMGAADELVGAKADIAKKTQVHQTVSEDGIMKMKHVHGVPLPAKGMATLKPGSYHVMFMGLHKPLMVGHSFPLTLMFKNAGELKVMVEVRKLGGKSGKMMDHKMDNKMDQKKKN